MQPKVYRKKHRIGGIFFLARYNKDNTAKKYKEIQI